MMDYTQTRCVFRVMRELFGRDISASAKQDRYRQGVHMLVDTTLY